MTKTTLHPTRTVAVLGAAYGGIGAAALLAERLPAGWRVVAIDRQSHANHVYPFPRFTVLPEHAPKAFIPLQNVFVGGRKTEFQVNVPEKNRTGSPIPPVNPSPGEHRLVHGIITGLTPHSVTFVKANAAGNFDDVKDDASDAPPERVETVDFDYCVYALGGALSAPSDVWGDVGRPQFPGRGTKAGGVAWLTRCGGDIARANSVTVVGGGALGIQFATDIKEVYPTKEVTLLHSRARLMPIYHEGLHDAVVKRCAELGINLVLGERVLEWPEKPGELEEGKLKTVRTSTGREISSELVLVCTGTKPSVSLVAALDEDTIAPNGCIRIKPSMQIRTERATNDANGADPIDVAVAVANLSLTEAGPFDHMFAAGDCADTTAIRAGHMAFAQASVAARNVLRLIEARERGETPELEAYDPDRPLIKVSLGLKHNCIASDTEANETDGGVEDLQAPAMWSFTGAQDLAHTE